MGARPPRLDGEFLAAAPDADSIAEFAMRYPNRWAQALIMIGKLSGFHERMEVSHEHRHLVAIHEMSDMELMQRLHEVMKQLGIQSDQLPDTRSGLRRASRSRSVKGARQSWLSVPGLTTPPGAPQ